MTRLLSADARRLDPELGQSEAKAHVPRRPRPNSGSEPGLAKPRRLVWRLRFDAQLFDGAKTAGGPFQVDVAPQRQMFQLFPDESRAPAEPRTGTTRPCFRADDRRWRARRWLVILMADCWRTAVLVMGGSRPTM